MLPQNPFIARREIAYGEPFCDRELEIQMFMDSATSDEAICLLSPRRYGKSSLVNQVLGRLAEKGWITLRLDLMTIRSLPGLIEALERKRIEASSKWTRLKERAASVASRLQPQVEIDPETGTPSFSLDLSNPRAGEEGALMAALEKLCSLPATIEKPVVLALDEFQEVAALDSKGRIVGMIRSAFQRRSRGFLPVYLGSQRHMLRVMFQSESAPLYRSARIVELKELGESAFAGFMSEQFHKSTGKDLPDCIGRATAAVFGGHPHALNLTASRLWTAYQLSRDCGDGAPVNAWANMLKEIIWALINEERAYYLQINRNLSPAARNVLVNIARLGRVSEPYSAEFSKICRLTPGQIQTALRILTKEDKILEGNGGYLVLDPLEALCLKTENVNASSLHAELDRLIVRSGG